MQADAIEPGQTVIIVDDIIATGASIGPPECLLLENITDKRTVFFLEPLDILQVDRLRLQANS